MTISAFLLVGLSLAVFLAFFPHKLLLTTVCGYWLIAFTWALQLIPPFTIDSYTWVPVFAINISYQIDGLSRLFMTLISGIGVLAILYSWIYTHFTPEKRAKLLSLMQLFAVSMFALVMADDFVFLFLCWEMTALSSFLLIQFNTTSDEANTAAFTGMFITVLGSLVMLVGFILFHSLSGTWSMSQSIGNRALLDNTWLLSATFICILIGCMSKSAQFPFYFWLPGAMQAPTPVSAYLHSATLVNAGIYLLARVHPLLGDLKLWYPLLATFAMSTMLLSSILSLIQDDLKAILAYTTLYILSAMVYLLGSGESSAIEAFALLLLFHGLYKAAAFMLVGTLDQAFQTRDIHKLQGIARQHKLLPILLMIIMASMAGLPPFFGFTVKAMIYEAKVSAQTVSPLMILISVICSMFVAAASFRVLWYFFRKTPAPLKPKRIVPFGQFCSLVLCIMILLLNVFTETIRDLLKGTIDTVLPDIQTVYVNPNTQFSFGLSVSALLGGLGIYYIYRHRQKTRIYPIKSFSLQPYFDRSLSSLLVVGKRLTLFTQEQPITNQLRIIFGFSLLFIVLSMLSTQYHQFIQLPYLISMLTFNPLYLILCGLGISLIISRKFLINLLSLSLIGIAVGFFFMTRGAVDLAIAMMLVEVLTIIVLLIALHHYQIYSTHQTRGINITNLLIALSFGLCVTLVLLTVKKYPLITTLQNYYLNASLPLAFGKNVVNTILVDFRALDTFGEALVMVATGLSVYLLSQRTRRGK